MNNKIILLVEDNPDDRDLTLMAHSRQLKQKIAISLSVRRFLRSDFTCLRSGS